MHDLTRLLQLWLEQLQRFLQPLSHRLFQPLLTVCLLVFLYAGWHVRDEGSIASGLRVAFIDTRAFRQDHEREKEVGILQNELGNAAGTDARIEQLLVGLLARTPLADRVRLGVVHNGITGVTGVALLRYDITNVVVAPGRAPGPLLVNQPLSDWNDFLPVLLVGKCFFGQVDENRSAAIRARFESLGVGTFMVCPVTDSRSRILGATFVAWSTRELPPTGEPLQALMHDATIVGAQIGNALDTRGKGSPMLGPGEAG